MSRHSCVTITEWITWLSLRLNFILYETAWTISLVELYQSANPGDSGSTPDGVYYFFIYLFIYFFSRFFMHLPGPVQYGKFIYIFFSFFALFHKYICFFLHCTGAVGFCSFPDMKTLHWETKLYTIL